MTTKEVTRLDLNDVNVLMFSAGSPIDVIGCLPHSSMFRDLSNLSHKHEDPPSFLPLF